MTHLTLEQWGIVVGIVIAILTFIGVLARMFNKMGVMSYQMSSMVKEWYTGDADSKPLKEQIDDITHMVQIAERNTRPDSSDDHGHDRIHARIDELANDLHSSMRIVYKGQQQLQESINRLSERYQHDGQSGSSRTHTNSSSDSATIAS